MAVPILAVSYSFLVIVHLNVKAALGLIGMDFQKTSHLRSLIPAVLVGLLALAANQYAKMDPTSMRKSIAALEKHLTELTKAETKPLSPTTIIFATYWPKMMSFVCRAISPKHPATFAFA